MSVHTIVCVKSTHVLVKRQLESRQRQLEKTAVKVGAYIVSDWKLVKLPFLKNTCFN